MKIRLFVCSASFSALLVSKICRPPSSKLFRNGMVVSFRRLVTDFKYFLKGGWVVMTAQNIAIAKFESRLALCYKFLHSCEVHKWRNKM